MTATLATPDAPELVDDTARLLVPVDVRAPEDDDGSALFGTPDAADLRLINKLALDRLAASEVFTFRAAISNTLVDSYFTHMAPSSLRNYVKDAKRGIAVMNSHRTGGWRPLELAIGRSYQGEVVKDGDVSSVVAAAYMRRGSNSNGYPVDSVIEDIRAGIISDVSIGFHGGRWVCDSCGEDFFYGDCPHWPGMPDTDGNLVTVTVENAGLSEFSLVYDGATPGAAIQRLTQPPAAVRKAERLAGDGLLSTDAIRQIEGQLHQRITPVRTFPGMTIPAPHGGTDPLFIGSDGIDVDASGRVILRDATRVRAFLDRTSEPTERTDDMTGAELIAGTLANSGETIPEEMRTRLESVREQMEAANGTAEDAARALIALVSETQAPAVDTAELDRLTALVAELQPQAADGKAYRESLVAETLAAGVRAHGNDFQRAMWESVLREPSRTLDQIRAFQTQFDDQAKARLGNGGRNTQPLDPNDPTGLVADTATATPARNATAYSAGPSR